MTLYLTEDPKRAARIATALSCTRHEFGFHSTRDIVFSTNGFMTDLWEPHSYDPSWRAWSLNTLPIIPPKYRRRMLPASVDRFMYLQRIYPKLDSIVLVIDTTDEAALIVTDALSFLPSEVPVHFLALSGHEFTPPAFIRAARSELLPYAPISQRAIAPFAKRAADWLIGINFSRLLTLLPTQTDTLYVGRRQTTQLRSIAKNETEPAIDLESLKTLQRHGLIEYTSPSSQPRPSPSGRRLLERIALLQMDYVFTRDFNSRLDSSLLSEPETTLRQLEDHIRHVVATRKTSGVGPLAHTGPKCPKCFSTLRILRKVAVCSSKCGFLLVRKILDVNLDETQIRRLVTEGSTAYLQFSSRAHGQFVASLYLRRNFTIGFKKGTGA